MPGGPKTRLTPAVRRKIVTAIEECACSLDAAAAQAGIHPSTLYRWLAQGRQEAAGAFRELHQAVTAAKARSEVALARLVAQAGEKDWRAAAWLLERRFPDDYGSQLTILKRLEQMSDEELEAFVLGRLHPVEPGGHVGGPDAPEPLG